MSRTSPSRQSSFSYIQTPSRRSSVGSNPDVFSDDYALEPMSATLDFSLHDPAFADHTLDDEDQPRASVNITPYPAIPARLSVLNRPTSTSKRPAVQDDSSSIQDGATQRTLSTSSRFSFIRAQSPYSGPTQPSHPYAMYPQITRASSIASASTIRPPENPFVPIGGPEHPYGMYHQNTVPEDDDNEDIGTQPIPLGFQRLGLGPQGIVTAQRSDVGEIVGTDGHIEYLPPYTRYADNVVAKGDMANISDTSSLLTTRRLSSRRLSQRSTAVPSEGPSQRTEYRDDSEREILLDEDRLKETWKQKAQKKVCGSIALWLLILIFVLVVLAGVIGGVIGGVVGRHQAVAALEITTTIIDGDPASTNKDTPACPTGHYTIPFKQTQDINFCVENGGLSNTWGCLDFAYLGITISDHVNASGNTVSQITFDDYSVNTSQFLYGPQPPDFNGTAFDLAPYYDKDNPQFGIGMFFLKTFDKLIILPGKALQPSKRGVEARDVLARQNGWDGQPLQIGHEPWFCFWNSTINEFWIYLTEPAPPVTQSSSAAATPAPDLSGTSQSINDTTASSSSPMWSGMSGFSGPGPAPTGVNVKRSYNSPYYPDQPYPKLVRMVEKRFPEGNIQPYCQRMQIMPDWSIVPDPQVGVIPITESQYSTNPLVRRGPTEELKSNCVCEWLST